MDFIEELVEMNKNIFERNIRGDIERDSETETERRSMSVPGWESMKTIKDQFNECWEILSDESSEP